MRMKLLLIGLSLLLLFTTTQARPQANTVRLDVQVTHVKSTEGVPEALITLQGPYSASSTNLYTPSSALTPDMREQIDILFKSAPTGISGAIVIDAARRMEAQFMGLPTPSFTPQGPSAVASGQVWGGVNDAMIPSREGPRYCVQSLGLCD